MTSPFGSDHACLAASALGLPLSVCLTLGATAQAGPPPVSFTDVTATAGVALDGTLTESVAWGDYDDDGDEDLYLTSNGANALFRNDGGDLFTDVTTEAGVGNAGFSVGTAFGDLDNDGDLDLYVVNFGAGADVLYRNDGPVGPGGVYVFSDVTVAAQTTIERSSRGMALLDYDRDGLLDIYVNAIGEDILYRNLGGLLFVDVAGALGTDPAGTGVGVVATDVDDNGWIDIYNGNRSGDLSNLFMNGGGTFVDVAAAAGVTASGLGMGVLALDYDNDLDVDLYWTTWPGGEPPVPNRLYENQGGSFVDVAPATGTDDPGGWGISCNAGDVDNDRWMDFVVTNGFSSTTTPNVLFRNELGASFADVTAAIGGGAFDGRGAAFADYDGDGDLDLCITGGLADSTRLWRNDTGNGNHWVSFELTGRSSNRSGIGARIEVTAGGVTTMNEVSGGAGRGSFNSIPAELGLGGATSIESVSIRWPSGVRQLLEGLSIDMAHAITEPIAGDLDGDDVVGVTDLLQLLGAWGACDGCVEDLDADGRVSITDLLLQLSNWG